MTLLGNQQLRSKDTPSIQKRCTKQFKYKRPKGKIKESMTWAATKTKRIGKRGRVREPPNNDSNRS